MLKSFVKRIIITSFLVIGLGSFGLIAKAQENQPQPAGGNPPMQAAQQAPNLLKLLDLSPEQIQQIRRIQKESRPEIQEAQRTQREAQKALNQAIYAEVADKDLVEQRLREFSAAQRRTVEIRTRTEFRVRQVLTPEQLTRFKELRERLEQRLLERRKAQEANQNRKFPNRPLINQNKDGQPLQNRRLQFKPQKN